MNMGLIQEGIFDVKLNMSSENKIYFGLLKKFNSPTTQEYFMSGSSIPTVANKSYSCMLKDSPCTDNQQKQHNARVTLLKDNKEFYACGDFQN